MNKKLINVVKGDINTALENGSYNRNTTYQTNIEFNTPTKLILLDGIPYSSPLLTKVTWQELKDKRDASELTPGTLYRITDYQCTTTQENTRSAGHQFDIVLLALSENKLAEEGWAMIHPTDVYDVTFDDGVTKKCYIYKYNRNGDFIANVIITDSNLGIEYLPVDGRSLSIDETNKTAVCGYDSTSLFNPNIQRNYFQNSNLSAWKVWYCLDNDKSRFAWADDSVDKGNPASIEVNGGEVFERSEVDDASKGKFRYAWRKGNYVLYTQNTTPSQGDRGYFDPSGIGKPDEIEVYNPPQEGTGLPNGRGVIYRLIDEWNNDVPYDFKNIQFVRKLTDGAYDPDSGEDTWVHTFTWLGEDGVALDASVVAQNITNGQDGCTGCHYNVIGACSADGMGIKGNTFVFALNDIVFISAYSYRDGTYYGCYGNKFGADCHSNTFGNGCTDSTFGNGCTDSTFGNYCQFNTFGNNCISNTFGNYCAYNTFRYGCGNSTFGDSCAYNTFGNGCTYNTFGNDCGGNTFGDGCSNNTFKNFCTDSTFGDACNANTFGNNCQFNIFGNNCISNTFGNYCSTNTFGNSCQFNTFGNNCIKNTFGNGCSRNSFGNNAEKCSVGDGVQNITVSKDFIRYVIIENGNQKITITSNKTTSSSTYLQNFLIALGVNNSNTAKTISHNSVNDAFRTVYQNENSTSVNV